MERASKRSRSATRPSGKTGKRALRSKSAAVAKHNKSMSKVAAARVIANATTAGFLGIEKKFLDTYVAPTAIGSAAALTSGMYDPVSVAVGGCVSCISAPGQGSSEQQRNGKQCTIDSVVLKGFVENAFSSGTAVEAATKVFVAVVLDTETNAAQCASEAIFKNVSGSVQLAADPAKNLLGGNRFRILKSQTYDLTPSGAFPAGANYAANSVRRDFDWYIPFKGGLPVHFNATGTDANIANVVDNSIHVVAFATLAGANIAYNARVRFMG